MSDHHRSDRSKDHAYARMKQDSRSKSKEKSKTTDKSDSKNHESRSKSKDSENKHDNDKRSKSNHKSEHDKDKGKTDDKTSSGSKSSKQTEHVRSKSTSHSSSKSSDEKQSSKSSASKYDSKHVEKHSSSSGAKTSSTKSDYKNERSKTKDSDHKTDSSSKSKHVITESSSKSKHDKIVDDDSKSRKDKITDPRKNSYQNYKKSEQTDPNNNSKYKVTKSNADSDSEGLCSDTDNDNEAQMLRKIKDKLAQLENRHAYSFNESDHFIQDSQFHEHSHDSSYAVISESSILNRIDKSKSEKLDISHDSAENFMDIFNEGVETEKKGKPLSKDAMYLVENFFDREPDKDVAKTLKERYLEPENTENLSSKEVNVEIYRCLDANVKKRDFFMKNVQGMMCTSSIANLRMVEEISELYKNKKISHGGANALLKYASDSTKMLARAQSDISLFRKFLMKPHLQFKYQQLCAKRTFGKHLFGNDLGKEIKEIDEESKIMKTVGKSKFKTNRYEPYKTQFSNNQQTQRGRGFLSRPYQRGSRQNYRSRGRGQATPSHTQTKQ